MSELDKIPVQVQGASWAGGNAAAILHEISHALQALLETGRETTIDLNSLPMGPGDDERLDEALGSGEVEACLHALGRSVIRETRIHGVWRIEHFNSEDRSMGRYIEVTHVPAILKAQPEDIREGLEELNRRLHENDS